MKRKVIFSVCCALALCTLAGCQLAKDSAGADADSLIGVLITTEYLDLFDFNGYLNDNINSFLGGEINMNGDAQEHQGRLYAVLVPRELINEETGETMVMHEYVFEDVDAISYFVPTIEATEMENSYVSTMSDPAISDGHTNLFVGDDENSVSLDGTIFVAPSSKERTYYFNPAYQSADGSVYAVAGNGFFVNSEAYSEGSVFSQTLDATTTITENGKAKRDSISIKISISVMFAPEKIVILQMDAGHMLISESEFEPGAVPDTYALEASTAYFVIEAHRHDDIGNPNIFREVYGRDTENIETFSVRAGGVCIKNWTQIVG